MFDELSGTEPLDTISRIGQRTQQHFEKSSVIMQSGSQDESYLEHTSTFSKQPTQFARISLEDLTITTTKIGSGNFANIFLVTNPAGKKYALKVFRTTMPQKQGITQEQMLAYIKQNIFNNKQIVSRDPFTQLEVIPEHGSWYLMDYFEGITLGTALHQNKLSSKQKQLALLTYANMLHKIHEKGLCYVDINPNNILVSDPTNSHQNITTRVCDYDLMATEDALFDSPFSQLGSVAYASREQLIDAPYRQVSDLESFALLLDHIYNNAPLRDVAAINPHELRRQAMSQEQLFPDKRLSTIPTPLRDIMREVLIYERGDAPSAKDFILALEKAA